MREQIIMKNVFASSGQCYKQILDRYISLTKIGGTALGLCKWVFKWSLREVGIREAFKTYYPTWKIPNTNYEPEEGLYRPRDASKVQNKLLFKKLVAIG